MRKTVLGSLLIITLTSCSQIPNISKAKAIELLDEYETIIKDESFERPASLTMEGNLLSYEFNDLVLSEVTISLSIDKRFTEEGDFPYAYFQIKGENKNETYLYERWSFVRLSDQKLYVTICERGSELENAKRQEEEIIDVARWEEIAATELSTMESLYLTSSLKIKGAIEETKNHHLKNEIINETKDGSLNLVINYEENNSSSQLKAKFEDYLLRSYSWTSSKGKEKATLKWGSCRKDYPTLTDFDLENNESQTTIWLF